MGRNVLVSALLPGAEETGEQPLHLEAAAGILTVLHRKRSGACAPATWRVQDLFNLDPNRK